MRVVQAVRSDGFAGVERHIAVLARAQAEQGLTVHVIGGHPDAMASALRGATVHHTPAASTGDVIRELRALRDVDIVHVHMTAAEVAAVASRVRSPIVTTRHFAGKRLGRSPLRPLAPLIRRAVAAQVAVSRYVAESVDGRSVVIHPGVEPRTIGGPSPRARTVLVAQRHQPEKETYLALLAFAASGLGDQGWRLRVAGRGTDDPSMRALVTSLGVGASTELLGHCEDIADLMRGAAVLLAPCRREGLGMTVLEAMALGLPVVAARSGGHLETVGLAGDRFLFPPGDHLAAAKLLQELAVEPGEAAVYGRRLQSVQRRVFTPQNQARRTVALYEEVLGA